MNDCQHDRPMVLSAPLPADGDLPNRWAWVQQCNECGLTLATGYRPVYGPFEYANEVDLSGWTHLGFLEESA